MRGISEARTVPVWCCPVNVDDSRLRCNLVYPVRRIGPCPARNAHSRARAVHRHFLVLTLAAALHSLRAGIAAGGEPTRETLPNGAVLARYPGLPAIDSVGPEVTEAHSSGLAVRKP